VALIIDHSEGVHTPEPASSRVNAGNAMTDVQHKVNFVFMVIALNLALFATTAVGQDNKLASIFDGLVEARHSAAVAASIDGRIVRIAFQHGQIVKSGDVLIELDDFALSAELQIADGSLAHARATLRGAQHDYEVQKSLRKQGVAAENSYVDAVVARDIAQADVIAAEGRLKLAQYRFDRTKITAPISGQISQVNALVGSVVDTEAGNPLAIIVQLDPISVAFKVPYQQQFVAVTAGRTVEEFLKDISVEIMFNGISYEHPGSLQTSAPVVDPTDGTVTLRALFDNSQRLLRPGMKVSVKFQFPGN